MNLFERLNKGQPPPAEDRPKPEANTASSELARDLQKLHDWLQNDWNKPTIRARDICRLGPNSIRGRKRAVDLAKILVGHGWLIPNQTRRRNMLEWRVVRGLGGHPTLATVSTVAAAAGADARFADTKSSQPSQSSQR